MSTQSFKPTIGIVGLGYVGLPLALGLAKHYKVIGYDLSAPRIDGLKDHVDVTNEVSTAALRATTMSFSSDPAVLKDVDIFIVTVPTPVDADNEPDLGAIRSACATVGPVLSKGNIVVFESTVYPGVTEEVCGPALQAASGLTCGEDFFLGYSPERINPGDREHTVDRITKVLAGQTEAVTDVLKDVYGAVTNGNVFVARDIRTAEAAKVIENAQRDINIAFINEAAMIFNKIGLSTHDVLAAANTKWNFLPFTPGLVGGHCIGVDPFYLAHLAREIGHEPEVILAGRRINDGMAAYVAGQIDAALGKAGGRILMLGVTFKENVPDLRNSKVADMVRHLEALGHRVHVHDPHADPAEAKREFGLDLIDKVEGAAPYDCVVGAVPHAVYCDYTTDTLSTLLNGNGLVADLKGMWRGLPAVDGLKRWEL